MNERPGPPGALLYEELETAYQGLLENLWYAHHEFMGNGDGGRSGAALACRAVIQFLSCRHENPELATPLLALQNAFADLSRGVQPPLFALKATATQRPRSAQQQQIRRVAAVCLDILIELGDSLETASSYVARHVSRWNGVKGQAVTGTTVQNWREAQRRVAANSTGGFNLMRNHLLSLEKPRAEVERLLREGPPDIPKS